MTSPIKRHRIAGWVNKKKQDLIKCCLQETHFSFMEKYRFKVNGWKKIFHANENQKRTGVAINISDKIDIKSK